MTNFRGKPDRADTLPIFWLAQERQYKKEAVSAHGVGGKSDHPWDSDEDFEGSAAPLTRGNKTACTADTALKVVSKPRPRAVAAGLATSVAVDNPGGNFLIKKFSLVCKKALVAMAADDPALDVAATTVPARDESDDQHSKVIIVDREVVEENRVLALQNIALAIVAQQNKQQELNAGDINRSLEKQVDELVSDKLRQ